MTAVMDLVLCAKPAAAQWGENALVSFEANQVNIHINSEGVARLQDIQKAGRKLDAQGLKHLSFIGDSWDLEACWAFYQGYYNAKQDNQLDVVVLSDADQQRFDALKSAADWTRKTINLGPAAIYPQTLCESAASFLSGLSPEHVSYEIISGEDLLEQGWVGTFQVGKGSSQVPAMLQLDFNPSGNPDEPVAVALVGKGITFDSGGYSIKTGPSIANMKGDMAGAAAALGTVKALALNEAKVNVVAVMGMAANMVSQYSIAPGDVLKTAEGLTVEVLNTDAEGRLVLSDALWYAREFYKPEIMVDLATLTGSKVRALGNRYAGLFSDDEELVTELTFAGKQVNENLWRLPLGYKDMLKTDIADLKNIGSGGPGATTAASFLQHFVGDVRWAHLDIAGNGLSSKAKGEVPTGGTGFGVRLLSEWLMTKEK